MLSYIYVISGRSPNSVKIGTSRDPASRLKQLQTGHPEPLRLCHAEAVDPTKAKLIERIIHKTLALHRSKGEWFSISEVDAVLEVRHAMIRHEDDPAASLRNVRF